MQPARTLLLALSLLLADAQIALAGQVYRYVNDNGVTVIDDKVPPQFVPKGYDILDSNSLSLIQRVPRQLSEEELRSQSSVEARERLKEEEERRLRAWDESLLLRYSSIEDIEAARERALRDIQIRISILKSNLTTIKGNIEREQQKAADFERRGITVPEDMLKNIDIMRLEIEDTEQSIAMRREEVEEIKASFQRDMERFSTLIDRVQMRRQQGASSQNKAQNNWP